MRDYDGLVAAIRRCVESTGSDRATAYQADTGISGTMHVVVEEMVAARAAGVVFTADPTSARRDLAVVDAVAGLGESLVDGSTTSDHYEVDLAGLITDRQTADSPAITDTEVTAIAAGARTARSVGGEVLTGVSTSARLRVRSRQVSGAWP